MPVQSQFAVENLSEEAQALVRRMLDEKKSPSAITKAVRQNAGEGISIFAVTSYAASYWEQQKRRQQARQQTEELVRQAERQGSNISELLRAAFLEGFTESARNGALKKINPLQLEAAHRKRRELALKEKQARMAAEQKEQEMELKKKQAQLTERRVKVFEERLKLDREKMQAALDKLDRKAQLGEPLTAEDVKRIREIYGLYDEGQAEQVLGARC